MSNNQVKRFDLPVVATEFAIQEKTGTVRTKREGSVVREMAVATYDVTGGDSGSIATFNSGIFIPANAVITRVAIDVVTTFADGASDAATIAVGYTGAANAFTSAISIAATGNVWDAGLHGTVVGQYAEATVSGDTAVLDAARAAASWVKLAAEKEVIFTIAVHALTAGKMNVFVEYFISD